jgi:hypothetical protein
MLGQFVKWAAFAAVWKKVKPVFWGTLATALFTITVSAVLGEFVEFLRIDQELSGASAPSASQVRAWLVFSYLGKFALILLSTGAWLVYLRHKGYFANGKQAAASDKALTNATVHTEKAESAPARYSKEFEFLRGDRPLRSRGQAILNAKSAA